MIEDDIDKQLKKIKETLCGFSIFREGKEYPLTFGEAEDAMKKLLFFISRHYLVDYMKAGYNTSFPDTILDNASERYVDKAIQEIPHILEIFIRADLE